MKLATSLALKWLGGIAAVGGATGGVLCYKAGYFGGGSNETKDKEVPKKVPENQSGPNVKEEVDLKSQAGVTDEAADAKMNPPDPGDQVPVPPLKLIEEDGLGLPGDCENVGDCILDENKIKKVKFQALGDSRDPVTVSPTSNLSLTLYVEGEKGKKKYIFKNDSDEITLTKKGSSLQLPNGKTKFIEDNKKLKKLEEGDYGLPENCKEKTPCFLTSTDLETIKFSDFEDGGLLPVITVEGLGEKKEKIVTLTIEEGKYIFNSPVSVDIKSGNTTVELSQGETEFKVDNGKLKNLEPWSFGLPEDCKFEDNVDSKNCSLSLRDLKKIKFKDVDTVTSISGLKDSEKVNLEIKRANDSSYPDGRKYIFTPKGSSDVIINGNSNQPIVLSKTAAGGNIFKKERDNPVLVAVPKKKPATFDTNTLDNKISGLGLPDTCTFTNKASGENKSIECELSNEELKKLKFSVGNVSDASGGQTENTYGDPITYKLKIEESEETQFGSKNIRLTFLNKGEDAWNSDLVISFSGDSEGGNPLFIANQSNTEFKINDKKELELAWKDSTLSAMVGLKCPASDNDRSCSLKEENGTIKVLIEGKEKEFKVNKTDIENNMKYETNQSEYSQGIKIEVENSISGTNGANGEAITLDKDSYEIRRISGKGWRLAKKSSAE